MPVFTFEKIKHLVDEYDANKGLLDGLFGDNQDIQTIRNILTTREIGATFLNENQLFSLMKTVLQTNATGNALNVMNEIKQGASDYFAVGKFLLDYDAFSTANFRTLMAMTAPHRLKDLFTILKANTLLNRPRIQTVFDRYAAALLQGQVAPDANAATPSTMAAAIQILSENNLLLTTYENISYVDAVFSAINVRKMAEALAAFKQIETLIKQTNPLLLKRIFNELLNLAFADRYAIALLKLAQNGLLSDTNITILKTQLTSATFQYYVEGFIALHTNQIVTPARIQTLNICNAVIYERLDTFHALTGALVDKFAVVNNNPNRVTECLAMLSQMGLLTVIDIGGRNLQAVELIFRDFDVAANAHDMTLELLRFLQSKNIRALPFLQTIFANAPFWKHAGILQGLNQIPRHEFPHTYVRLTEFAALPRPAGIEQALTYLNNVILDDGTAHAIVNVPQEPAAPQVIHYNPTGHNPTLFAVDDAPPENDMSPPSNDDMAENDGLGFGAS